MTWYDGKKLPPAELFEKVKWPKEAIKDGPKGDKAEKFETSISGALIIGDKGSLYSPGDYADKFYLPEGMDKPKLDLERPPYHFVEFTRAIKEGKQPRTSNFPDYSGPLTEVVLLGNLAVWSGKKVEWDAKNLVATTSPGLSRRPVRRSGRQPQAGPSSAAANWALPRPRGEALRAGNVKLLNTTGCQGWLTLPGSLSCFGPRRITSLRAYNSRPRPPDFHSFL